MEALGSLVLGLNILLLIAGYLLFQQARSELNARAVQIPVLTEIKALQKSITALLEEMKSEASRSSSQVEARCAEARELLGSLDRHIEDARTLAGTRTSRRRAASPIAEKPASAYIDELVVEKAANPRHQEALFLAAEGKTPSEIAARTGMSVAEIEIILLFSKTTT